MLRLLRRHLHQPKHALRVLLQEVHHKRRLHKRRLHKRRLHKRRLHKRRLHKRRLHKHEIREVREVQELPLGPVRWRQQMCHRFHLQQCRPTLPSNRSKSITGLRQTMPLRLTLRAERGHQTVVESLRKQMQRQREQRRPGRRGRR